MNEEDGNLKEIRDFYTSYFLMTVRIFHKNNHNKIPTKQKSTLLTENYRTFKTKE